MLDILARIRRDRRSPASAIAILAEALSMKYCSLLNFPDTARHKGNAA